MTQPLVSIWPVREIPGWDGAEIDLPHCPPVAAKPLLDALQATYQTDAHFWPGYVVDASGTPETSLPRLNKGARPVIERMGGRILFGCLVLDIDGPEHKTGGTPSPEWISDQTARLAHLPVEWASFGIYLTRGGYRLLWRRDAPVGPEQHIEDLEIARDRLATIGIQADALIDWTRSYRLPFVRRSSKNERREAVFDGLVSGTLSRTALVGSASETTGTGRFSRLGRARARGESYKAPDRIASHRNVELTRLAGALRRAGLDVEAVRAALRHTNQTRCDPPMDDAEVDGIADKSARWDPPDLPESLVRPPENASEARKRRFWRS